ncbi:MAG TPA: thiamine-phosphate kinase [Thermoplasmata archaeon]|nr:thiamine-phosphate kinase [Thermoplasmata archaeon]
MPRTVPSSSAPVRERAFHERLARLLPAGHLGLLPLGDDAAAMRPPPGSVTVISTDSLVEGVHFLPRTEASELGAAAAAVSLSDVASKGARPAGILLGLILPAGTPQRWAEGVVRGAERLGAGFGAHVIGGDTKPGPVRAVASTVFGWASAGRLAPRSGARAGDLVVTTGTVGRGGLAAARLRAEGPDSAAAAAALVAVRPRVREGVALAPFAHAMIDTSDGLAESARLVAAASGVRLSIREASLPFARGLGRAARGTRERRALAFFGGDYELLATVPPARLAAAERAVQRVGGALSRIGRVDRGRGAWLVTPDGRIPMPPAGWQPFGGPGRHSGARRRVPAVSRRDRVHATLK